MNSPTIQKSLMKKDGALIVAFCTLMGYLCAYFYEIGFLSSFGIPWEFAQVTLQTVLMITAVYLFLHFWDLPSFYRKQQKNNSVKEVIPVFIVFLVLLILFVRSQSYVILSFAALLLLLIGIARTLQKLNTMNLHIAITAITFLLIVLSLILGFALGYIRQSSSSYPSFHYEKLKFAVIRIYGDDLLVSPISASGTVLDEVRMMSLKYLSERGESIHLDKIQKKIDSSSQFSGSNTVK